VSATTWPEPAVEFVVAWQPPCAAVSPPQLAEVEAWPAGGPRDPVAPLTVFGPSLPIAVERTLPEQPPAPCWQVWVAVALDHDEAPATVGATFAPAPGEPGGAGGVAGCCPPLVLPPLPLFDPLPPGDTVVATPVPAPALPWPPPVWEDWSPMLWDVVVAFCVEGAATSGAISEASGPADAPELVTAWQPPVVFWQLPVPVEPRGSGEMSGSVPVAVLDTVPVQVDCPVQLSAAPDAEAADGPDPPVLSWVPER
jgi:hypothetical protein